MHLCETKYQGGGIAPLGGVLTSLKKVRYGALQRLNAISRETGPLSNHVPDMSVGEMMAGMWQEASPSFASCSLMRQLQPPSSSNRPKSSHSPLRIHTLTMNGRRLPALLVPFGEFAGRSPPGDQNDLFSS